jgi:hypothetical protein
VPLKAREIIKLIETDCWYLIATSGLPSGATWQTAIQVTGATTANPDTDSAAVGSVSCASSGNCSAGGYYVDSSGHHQAFIVDEN